MNWQSVAYVVLAWMTSIFVTAFVLLSWDSEPWSMIAALAFALAGLAYTAGSEIAGWWRVNRAVGDMYLKVHGRMRTAQDDRAKCSRTIMDLEAQHQAERIQIVTMWQSLMDGADEDRIRSLEAVLAAEPWSPEARAGIRACISKLKTGDHRACLNDARARLGIAPVGEA